MAEDTFCTLLTFSWSLGGLADSINTTHPGHFEHVRRWISLDPRYYTHSCDPIVAMSALSFQITAGKDTEHTCRIPGCRNIYNALCS